MDVNPDDTRSSPPEIVIPKEKAVFWLDANGCWHNEGGRFRNKKIIDFFHAAIRKDEGGYFLSQERGGCTEKVYFVYADTALFVFDVVLGDPAVLVLNTGQRVLLDPRKLYVQNDSLYTTVGEHRVKFTERSLMAISGIMAFEDDGSYCILDAGRRRRIEKR